ncbi:MAG: nucleotidyltransferase family protein [Clostridia bacterium]|nr:nucleotidyltransferase family protein [Clostridia bacterium]
MAVAAIITEYNPFHNGHAYQIAETRRLLGEDTKIIAIMSGNFTQRGEMAFADKTARAKAACECGVDLVLELPFPFSMSSAEHFARSGVKIANELGIVDYLVFGSESGDIEQLSCVAENMRSDEFKSALMKKNKELSECGHASLVESVYRELYNKDLPSDIFSPNNILAIEYIKALKDFSSSIIPFTIKRSGAGYNDSLLCGSSMQSASAIRELLRKKNESAYDYIPENAKNVFLNEVAKGYAPTDESLLDSAVISYFRLNSPKAFVDIHEADGGLYNRLCQTSITATTISALLSMTETKKYTKARIRRAIWNSYFGVTSSDVKELPLFTQVLAMTKSGRSLLKKAKKVNGIPCFTKPSSYKDADPRVVYQKEKSNKADAVYDLARKKPISAAFALTFTPYVKD